MWQGQSERLMCLCCMGKMEQLCLLGGRPGGVCVCYVGEGVRMGYAGTWVDG